MDRIKVGIVGYGTIGKRVADAVILQNDMKLVGVTGNSFNFRMEAANNLGIKIFTVEDDKDFMNARIDKIADAAIEKGLVVAICHDRPKTVEVLEERLPELEARNITFIKVADIVR